MGGAGKRKCRPSYCTFSFGGKLKCKKCDWIYAGCNIEIGHGRFLNCLNAFWHPKFFRCYACHLPIYDYEERMADFLACPFSMEEESEGVIEEIAKLCSFEKLKDLAVNKSGKSILDLENNHLFRNGKVGDWENYISPTMLDQLSHVMEEKLGGSGLEFKLGKHLNGKMFRAI